jgi:importin subunit beta-1
LQSVIRKVKPEHMNELSDKCMESLLKMLGSSHGIGSVQEDALQAVGTLIEVVGNDFEKYMPHFQPFLCQGLENHQESSVCIAAVGVVTDICRAMQKNFGKYFEVFMNLMYNALTNPNVHHHVKPQIVAAMGDAALALGPDFKRYLEPVLMALQQASNFQVNPNDYEMLEYQADLREACLDAFTGIIQGLKGDDNPDENLNRDVLALEPHLEFIFKFLCQIAVDKDELNDTLLSSSVGLIGDISMAFGPLMDNKALMKAFSTEGIQYLLSTGAKSKVDKTKRLSNWAIKHIKKIERGAF